MRSYATGGATTDFLYDGDRLVAEYVGGALTRRYVHGPGVDEPLVQYTGAGTSDRAYLIADHQGSVIAENGSGTIRYSYGPYGEPNTWVGSRLRYTGQIALPEIQLYHYKARVYDPVLAKFNQTDPVGYEPDMNLYLYVRNDPLNLTDSTGLCDAGICTYEEPAPTPPPTMTQEQKDTLTNVSVAVLGGPILAVGCALGGCQAATLATVGRAVLIGSTVGGTTSAAVEGANQINAEGRISDLGAVGRSFEEGVSSGFGSAAGGRVAGTPGAMVGAYAGAVDEGASPEEASWSAVGAAVGRLVIPAGPAGEALGAQIFRQVFRSTYGKGFVDAAQDAEDELQ